MIITGLQSLGCIISTTQPICSFSIQSPLPWCPDGHHSKIICEMITSASIRGPHTKSISGFTEEKVSVHSGTRHSLSAGESERSSSLGLDREERTCTYQHRYTTRHLRNHVVERREETSSQTRNETR